MWESTYCVDFQGLWEEWDSLIVPRFPSGRHFQRAVFFAKPEKKAGLQTVKLNTEVPAAELVGAGRVYVPASSTP